MAQSNQNRKFKYPQKKIVSLNYCIRPKTVINTPMNKYDLTQIQPDIDNLEITEYFNYGFNSQTFSSYAKLCKRFAQIQEIQRVNHNNYDAKENNQFRFNDDMPIDLGGFGPFLDKQLINLWEDKNINLANSLMEYFVKFNICLAFNKNNNLPSLTSFIGLMNRSQQNQDYSLFNLVDNLAEKINQKYQKTLKILTQKQAGSKIKEAQLQDALQKESQTNFYQSIFSKNKAKSEQRQIKKVKKEEVKQQVSQDKDSICYSSVSQSSEEEDRDRDEPKSSLSKNKHKQQYKQTNQRMDKHQRRQKKYKQQKDQDEKAKSKRHKSEKNKHQKTKRKHKKIKKHKTHKKHKKHGKKASKKHKK